jgi:hypothetical protein
MKPKPNPDFSLLVTMQKEAYLTPALPGVNEDEQKRRAFESKVINIQDHDQLKQVCANYNNLSFTDKTAL